MANDSRPPNIKRLSIDLLPQAAHAYQQILDQRGMTDSEAVRAGLSLLLACDPGKQIILRKRPGLLRRILESIGFAAPQEYEVFLGR